MNSVWREYLLGDVINLKRGYDLPQSARRPGNIPIISSSGITDYHDTHMAVGPGVVTGRYGTLGEVFYVTGKYWPLNTALYVQDFKGNHPRFVSFLLKTLPLVSQNAAGAIPGVNRNHLHMLPVRLPTLAVQRRVAETLSAYDDLIEVNQRRIAILEEMARRLFDEWFVHFRYPGYETKELIEDDLGAIPRGWKRRVLSWWADDVRDAVSPSDVDGGSIYVGLEHLPRRSTTLVECGRADAVTSQKLRFRPRDMLFGKIRPYFHKVAYVTEAGVCSTDAIVLRAKRTAVTPYVLGLISSDAFVAHAVTTSNGTKMPRADWKVLRDYHLPEPPAALLERYCALVGHSLESAANFAKQNARLRAARDLLLPKLISGEIDVSRAEATFAEAAE